MSAVMLVIFAAAIGVGLALLVLGVAPAKRGQQVGVAGALEAINQGYGRAEHAATAKKKQSDLLASTPQWLQRLAVRLSPNGIAGALQHRLDLAGNPSSWTPDRILATKGLGLVGLAVLGALIGLHNPALLLLYGGVGGFLGFFVPDLLLYNSGIKRQQQITATMPDALDMLTVCVEAGLSFDAALGQVARNTTGALAAEFARALQEMQIGLSRAQALRGMVTRTTVSELRAFVSSLIQASELGIPVANVLREQAAEMRTRRRQRIEEKAQKVPVQIMFPLIACLFPALLVIVVGPGAISIAHSLLGK